MTKAENELEKGAPMDGKTRRSGSGRKSMKDHCPGMEDEIRGIMDGKTYGDPCGYYPAQPEV
jgi:hypothetical protein